MGFVLHTHRIPSVLMWIFVSIELYVRVMIMMRFRKFDFLLRWGCSLLHIHLISMQIDFHSFVSHFH